MFGVPVYTHSQPNSASLGAAYRALHGWRSKDKFVPFGEVVKDAAPFKKEVDPDLEAHKIYQNLSKRYKKLEQQVIAK